MDGLLVRSTLVLFVILLLSVGSKTSSCGMSMAIEMSGLWPLTERSFFREGATDGRVSKRAHVVGNL